MRGLAATLLLCAAAAPAAAVEAHEDHTAHGLQDGEIAEAPAEQLRYAVPQPGSYELPPIERVSEHLLLDDAGAPAPLLALGPGDAAVVAFVYTRCTDGKGCPLALAVLKRLDRELAERPELGARARIVTVSFDPDYDTPARMADLKRRLRPASDWRFLTAASREALAPVLADYGQDALPRVDANDQGTGTLQHVLKVFLVNGRGEVRNIYSSGFLSADVLLADLETVLDPKAPGPR